MNKLTSSKFFVFILILIVIGVITAVGRESYRKYQINKELVALEQEIKSLKEKNQSLSNLLTYFESGEFLEKEARLKLNLVKDGEKLVIITQDKKSDLDEEVRENSYQQEASNFKKWWHYFFSH